LAIRYKLFGIKQSTFNLRRLKPESCYFGCHEWTFLEVGRWVAAV